MTHNLRDMRRDRGLTVEQAATEMGISKQALSTIELGRVPTAPVAFRVAGFYGLRVTEVWPSGDAPEVAA